MNSPDESKKLKKLFSENEKVKDYFNEITQVGKMLNQADEIEPDSTLKTDILRAISLKQYQKMHKENVLISWFRNFEIKVQLKYAFFFSAGLIVGLLILFLFKDDMDRLNLDESNFMGAVLLNEDYRNLKPVDEFKFNKENVSGEATIKSSENLVLSEIMISSDRDVDVSLEFENKEFSFAAFHQMKHVENVLNISGKNLILRNKGDNKYTIIFNKHIRKSSGIKLKISSSGITVFEKNVLSF